MYTGSRRTEGWFVGIIRAEGTLSAELATECVSGQKRIAKENSSVSEEADERL